MKLSVKELCKRWQTWAVLLLIVIFSISANCFFLINAKKDRLVEENRLAEADRGALSWVSAFVSRDFSTCDFLVENQNFRLYSPLVVTQSQESRYYERVLDGVVSCVTDISLLSVDDNEYKFRVCLHPVEVVDELAVAEKVGALRGNYIGGSMPDSDFTSKLKDIYFNAFSESCFVQSEETKEFIAVLTEVEVDGVVYVSGTVDFVDLVLSESGLEQNFKTFETAVKSEVDATLKSGFEE